MGKERHTNFQGLVYCVNMYKNNAPKRHLPIKHKTFLGKQYLSEETEKQFAWQKAYMFAEKYLLFLLELCYALLL